MRVPPYVVVTAAVIFKLWLWWRTLPMEAHHVIAIVATWLAWAFFAGLFLSALQ